METDVPVRGIDLDEHLALAEFVTRLGGGCEGSGTEKENGTACENPDCLLDKHGLTTAIGDVYLAETNVAGVRV